MTPQQRVGQLFVVRFPGTDVSPSSAIAELIKDFHVGGVQLTAANGNFATNKTSTSPTPTLQIAQLVRTLQRYALFKSADAPLMDGAVLIESIVGVPLLIVVEQDASHTSRAELREINSGVTALPSQLALGATWSPVYAERVGEIIGSEYASMGINVLIGPRLDLNSGIPSEGDLGTRSFGGDPFWVGKMGAAFVSGVHEGSEQRVAVIARSYPGLGVADRDVKETIPFAQRSLEQLRQFDLQPFFAVMRDAPGGENVDGVVMTHIRYRGLYGNFRTSTRPVSVDQTAHQALMAFPEVISWRENGGLVFSDALGARSLRRFYDPLDITFNGRRIAQEAFFAGNDVLMLGNFGLTNDWREQLANIKDVLSYFVSRYLDDPGFAMRVDEAALRVLALKVRLYDGDFARALQPSPTPINQGDMSAQNMLTLIARDSATALLPLSVELPAPSSRDFIVFFTDDRLVQECPTCEPYPAIPPRALEEIALNLYGPRATGLVKPEQLASYTFSDLSAFNKAMSRNSSADQPRLTPSAPGEPLESDSEGQRALQVASAINQASWLVFAMIDVDPAVPSSLALRDFLASSADSLQDKRVVVFAFGAPHYLGATEIGKLTAYFGMYSRAPAHLDAAVRLLFDELPPLGSSPVSISALNYNLLTQTAPDPRQVIRLVVLSTADAAGTPEPPTLKIGDRLTLRAGPILDANSRVVPDGTQVQFVLVYPAERVEQRLPAISTVAGFADVTITLERQGQLEIRAEAEPALTSDRVILDISDQVSIETIRPTPQPTPTLTPSATLGETSPQEPTPTVAPQMASVSNSPLPRGLANFAYTLLSLSVISLLSLLAQRQLRAVVRVRYVALIWIVGWLAYVVATLAGVSIVSELPWSEPVAPTLAATAAALMTSLSLSLFAPVRGSR